MMKLVFGNKLYSSWSMRPWLVLKAFDIPFEEVLIPLDQPDTKAKREAFAPSATVPILVDGDLAIWETLAIIEYLAEKFPEKAIWPTERGARAMARVVSSEMHAGFGAVRSACPMNFGKRFARKDRGERVARDVARIDRLMGEMREKYGVGGEYLFGAYCGADAMLTPLASRFETYDLPASKVTGAYFRALLGQKDAVAWREAGLDEPWIIAGDEADEEVIAVLRRA